MLSALPKIPEIISEAKKHNMSSIALTDDGNLYGAIEFYKASKKAGINPILGVNFWLAQRSMGDKEEMDKTTSRLILLAKDKVGYKSLIKLVTASYLEGLHHKPRIDLHVLEENSEGLICIEPSLGGQISELVLSNQSKALSKVRELKDIFGKENFFIEISRHSAINSHDKKMDALVSLAQREGLEIVAGHNTYYLKPEDKKARNTMLSIQSQSEARGRFAGEGEDFSFQSPKDMKKKFKDLPKALENTAKIAQMCDLRLELGSWVFPNYEIPEGSNYDKELEKLVETGIKKRGLSKTDDIKERMKYELDIIKQKGYSPYFLVVADLLQYARENGILTTIRGSVAGSLVTYLSGITNVNPLEYKLPFERFLNPERPSAPDIDMDFADNRRDEMIDYAKRKYGEDKVAQIGTFGTMLARGAVRDVARALGYSYNDGDRIAKLIPFGMQGFPMTIERALDMEPELKKIYKEEEETQEIINTALQIEGCARHISVHAAGVVIAPKGLSEYVPVQLDPKGGKIITQYDMHSVEDAGLLKFDFLGLKNLAILADAVRLVKKLYGKEIDIENIPLDDSKTFEMLARGETMGVFQLSGQAMTHYLKELKPSSIFDINAMVALYRPGPMESIPEYIDRKHNPHKIKYLDPRLEDIVDQSYGVITYQDDVMLIAIRMAGFSWLEADQLRKAMGKKIPKVMAEQKEKLIKGLKDHGMSEEKAQKLWNLIEPFAAYGFNKAHAASYGRVAYQTAYMKANFPATYMSAVLTADAGDVDKIAEIVSECERMEIDILPPDINESFGNFTVVEDSMPGDKNSGSAQQAIRFGLHSIKNFGHGIADTIIKERKENGKYTSITDFLDRIADRNLNKKSLESLIKCGAMDSLGERGQMLANLEGLLDYNKEVHKHGDSQDSLFGLMDESLVPTITLEKASPAENTQKLSWEKELLGLYVSGHPLDRFRERFEKSTSNISYMRKKGIEGSSCVLAGIVEDVKTILTKKGEKMAFLKISDFSGSIEGVAFPGVYKENTEILSPESCIIIKGKFSRRDGEPSVIVNKVKALE